MTSEGSLYAFNPYGAASEIQDEKSNIHFLSMFKLSQNYPNPFNPTTAIGYQLSAVSDVDLSIYNLLGQKVATLVNECQQAGHHQVEWDASGFASGVYYYRIEAGEFVAVRKMVLLR
jgi:flagellar hook assembly protein FlgD